LSLLVGFDQVAQHVDTGNRRDRVVCLLVFFDEDSERKQVFRLIGTSAVPTIAQTVERRDRAPLFLFGMDNAQRIFADYFEIVVTRRSNDCGHQISLRLPPILRSRFHNRKNGLEESPSASKEWAMATRVRL